VVRIILWGATGQARVLAEFLGSLGYELAAVFDNAPDVCSPFPGISLYQGRDGFNLWRQTAAAGSIAGLVAIGGSRGRDRVEIQRWMESQGVVPVVAIHPTAFVASDAHLGKGCQVLARAAVCTAVRMGEACIVNTSATVDHESILGDGVHIAPGATVTGCVQVGDYTLVGAGAVVLPRIRIGRNVIIGAGSVVCRDIPDNKVAYGNPARVRRDNVGEPS
jgi:sugar O-acyltransferase (sialic acid O-acetyltransferase NeuD family)